MTLDITRNGIAQRRKDGTTALLRPNRNGGPPTEIAVPEALADAFRLATGDIVAGETETAAEDAPDRLTAVTQINGLDLKDAAERPFPRTNRGRAERSAPDRWLTLETGAGDLTGRMLDFAVPLGAGVFGVVYGPHGSGLTRTLQTILRGVTQNAPDCLAIVLLLRARAEEATEWRGSFPQAEIVTVSSTFREGTPQQTLELCDLVLEAAQRQTEAGLDVVLLIDSLTGLWGAMLEAEEADAQQEADTSLARQRISEWARKAGCFHGAGLLGSGPGGSLTMVGAVWNQPIDPEAEEERDIHPHLRLLEYVLPEAAYQIALSPVLTEKRLYPAIDIKQCRSQDEEKILPAALLERLLTVRGNLPRHDSFSCYRQVMAALETSENLDELLAQFAGESNSMALEFFLRDRERRDENGPR